MKLNRLQRFAMWTFRVRETFKGDLDTEQGFRSWYQKGKKEGYEQGQKEHPACLTCQYHPDNKRVMRLPKMLSPRVEKQSDPLKSARYVEQIRTQMIPHMSQQDETKFHRLIHNEEGGNPNE